MNLDEADRLAKELTELGNRAEEVAYELSRKLPRCRTSDTVLRVGRISNYAKRMQFEADAVRQSISATMTA